MNYKSIDYQINEAKEKIKNLEELIKIADKLRYNINDMDIIIYNNFIAICPIYEKNEDIFKVREVIKKSFPNKKWSDEIYLIDKPIKKILIRYKNKSNDEELEKIEIWVHYENEKDLPPDITNNGKCHFEKKIEKKEIFVCARSRL
jgi:hypothetical protein